MKKHLLTIVLLLVGLVANAQWTKPTLQGQPLGAGQEVYLYNVDAGGFLVGANDWGTRASVLPTHGHKIWLEKFEYDGLEWDGQSYFLWNEIEAGGMAGKKGVMFISDPQNFWVDREVTSDDARHNGGFTFEHQGNNIYKIAPSPKNKDCNTENYPGCYLGVKPAGTDNRVYLATEQVDASLEADEWQTRWIFVSPEAYATYLDAVARYEAAQYLKAAIDKAKADAPATDIADVEAVYNNTASTLEQLRAAFAQLATKVGSPATPVDLAGAFLLNPTYANNNNDGWSGDTPDFQSYGNAEKWNGTVNHYQELASLPNGVYQVQATGYYRSGSNEVDAQHYDQVLNSIGEQDFQHFKLYANSSVREAERAFPLQNSGASDHQLEGASSTVQTKHGYVPNNMETAAVYTAAGQYAPTIALVAVADGKLTVGLRKTTTISDDWAIWDDWQLLYVGNDEAAYQWLAKQTVDGDENLEELIERDSEVFYQHSVFDAYKAARAAALAATGEAAILSAVTQYEEAYKGMLASMAAYAAYYKLYNEVRDWVETKDVDSEEFYTLADYLDSEAATGYNGNGSADYILKNGTLDAEQLKAEQAYLEQLWNDAVANSMSDGDDCTAMLRNANFADTTGWTYGNSVTLGVDGQQLMQGWNVVFDVYQELTGLQNGLYELSYNGLYRPSGAGNYMTELQERAKAFAYINNYETRLPGILDDLSAEAIASDDYNYQEQGYGPNSTTGASAHFQAGKYAAHAYGIVTDGTMRIGFKNDLRVDDNSVAWVGPVKLIFRAKNADALKEVIDNTMAIVNEKLTSKCGKPELDAMSAAATFASSCEDAALYQALIDLKQTIENVDLGVVAYQKLFVALFNLEQAILGNTTASEAVIDQAKALYAEALAAYEEGSYNTEEAEAKTTDINTMVVNILFPDQNASEENPVDYTSAIVNPTFDPARGSKEKGTIEGWTTTAMNGYKEYTVSYNRAPFELNQKLTGLPKGKYKVKVHTYYRAGYWNEEEDRVKKGEETHLTTLYAETSAEKFTTPVMNLYEDATDEPVNGVKCYTLGNGKYAPDGTSPTAAYFAAGYYLNELTFSVPEDGEVTIGLSKTQTYDNDYEVVGAWELWYMGDVKASEENPVDYSSVIVNPTFDPARGSKEKGTIEGWTTTAMNGYKENTVSYNRAGFELFQTLTGLPQGKFLVTVHTYYRAGYYNEEEDRISKGEETHLTTLYAKTSEKEYTTPVMNLSEGAADTNLGVKCYTLSNGQYAPDGTTPTAAFFAAGYYLNELRFTVPADGEVTIGLSKKQTYDNDYEVVGEWKLWYMGNDGLDDGVGDIEPRVQPTAQPVGVYSLSGARLSGLQRGINIIRLGDGSVRKILVK